MRKTLVLITVALLCLGSVFAVSLDEAKSIALADAGVSAGRVKAEKDKSVYEVEFTVDGIEYDYEVDISTGAIVKRGYEVKGKPVDGKAVGQSEAEAIALGEAAVKDESVSKIRVKSDNEDGRAVFEIDFSTDRFKYEVVVDKATGSVLEYQEEALVVKDAEISIDDAAALVLSRIEGSSRDSLRIKQDYENGKLVYEGELFHDGKEYEFEIEASTGRFLEWEIEKRK